MGVELLVPAVLGAVGLGTSIWQASEQRGAASKARREAAGQQKRAQEYYQQTAYRSPQAVESETALAKAEAARTRQAGYERLLQKTGPARGFGRGSGMLASLGAPIEQTYLSQLANIMNQATQLKTTPIWAPPGQAYGVSPTYQPSIADPFRTGFGRAAGYYATKSMLGGLETTPNYGTSSNWWTETQLIPGYEPFTLG